MDQQMKLSCVFAPTMQTPDHIAAAEKLGYGRAWTFDTPQQSPDVFMTLTRAAERTTEIGLGPGVLVPSLRHGGTGVGRLDVHDLPARVRA
jgi:5,10-methylenetetrahydromethanopterin reductase